MTKVNSDYDVLAVVFSAWWRDLQGLSKSGNTILIGGAPKAPNRGALAELRRIANADMDGALAVDCAGAIGVEAFRDLRLRLLGEPNLSNSVKLWLLPGEQCLKELKLEPFIVAAATLAIVRTEDTSVAKRGATARLLGAARGEADSQPVYAEARFKRLIRCRHDWPGLMAQARRIAATLEKQAPVGDLGASLVLWNSDPHIIRDWTFQYYEKSFEETDTPPAASTTSPAI